MSAKGRSAKASYLIDGLDQGCKSELKLRSFSGTLFDNSDSDKNKTEFRNPICNPGLDEGLAELISALKEIANSVYYSKTYDKFMSNSKRAG